MELPWGLVIGIWCLISIGESNALSVENGVTKAAPQKFHFIGICGTAMGSVAAALQERNFKISGSDESVYPPMSIRNF